MGCSLGKRGQNFVNLPTGLPARGWGFQEKCKTFCGFFFIYELRGGGGPKIGGGAEGQSLFIHPARPIKFFF